MTILTKTMTITEQARVITITRQGQRTHLAAKTIVFVSGIGDWLTYIRLI